MGILEVFLAKTFESDYKPFGEDANATGTEKYAFTGQYSEADIGLYYFGARWYDASLGRFISEDPIKGSMISSQSQNPYVYCMNNPLRYVDPTGMMGDIPDWSLPDDYFDDYVSSVGSLINTVVNTATEFASGVNHGVTAGTTSTSGSAGVPNPGTTYGSSNELGYGSDGQSYWDNGDINLPANQNPIEIHGNFSVAFISLDYHARYDSSTNRFVDRGSINTGMVAGIKIVDKGMTPISTSIMIKDIHTDLDTYLGTPAVTVTGGWKLGAEGSWGDTNGDGFLELLSSGIGYASPGVSMSFDTPIGSTAIFSNGGVIYNFIDRMRGG